MADAYDTFLLAVRRDVNCLADRDRMTKRNGLLRLDKAVRKETDHKLVAKFFSEELQKPLLSCFGDATEKVRDVALSLIVYLIQDKKIVNGDALNDVLPLLLAALLGRFRILPFPETSEELRSRFLDFLVHLTQIPEVDVSPYSHDLFDGLSKALSDSFPDAKKQAAALIADLCQNKLPATKVARSGKLLVPSLLSNVQHQQWKVRKCSVDCLCAVISASTANFQLLEDIFPVMHQLLNDRHPAVRRALSEMVQKLVHTGLTSHWAEERIDFDSDEEQLMKFERYEHRLLYLLLNCIVDGDEEGVGKPCLAKFEGLAETASEWWKKAEARRRRRQRNIEAAQKRVEAKLNGGEAEEEGEDAQSDAHVVDSEDFATEDEWNFPDFDHMIEQHAFKESSTCGALPSVFGTSIPSAKMCFYVYRHMERLLPQCLSNLIQWTSELRTSAARLLKLFLVFLHRFAAEKAEEILVHLYKAVEDEDADVRTNVHVCAQNLSLFVAAHTKQRLLVEIISTHLGIAYDSTEHAGGYLNREAAQRADSQHDEYWGETSMNRAKVRVEYDKKKEKPFVAISLENKRQVLKILAQVAKVFSYEDSPEGVSEDVLSQIVRFLEESATLDELLLTILELLSGVLVDPSSGDSSSSSTSTFSTGKKKMLSKQWTRIFDILLRCKSSVDPTENSAEVARIVDLSDQCIEALASRVCDCSVPDVYRLHLSSQLHTLLEQADLIQWPESSPKRAIFDLLVKNSVHAISGEHLDRIVPVLAKQAAVLTPSAPRHNDELEQEVAKEGSTLKSVQTGVSPRARIDILGILHFLVMQSTKFEVVKEGLRRHALFLWEEMLLPNASWRPGQSQNKIRKATMVCIHQFLELDLIDTSSLETLFPDVLPILRTCMDDSWSPDNRLVATLVTTLLLEKLDSLEDEQLRDLYPELLKRLDDSQDEVRATACAAFSAFFRALPEKWSPNLFQYILTSLFIHFDDPNPRIQHAVQACLETALHHNLAVFVQEAEKASVKAVHAKQLSDLILVAKNLMEN